jgi:hypothetical protein
MKLFDTLLGYLPSWVPLAVIAGLVAALIGGFFALKSAWQAEATASFAAAVNGAAVRTMNEQVELNQDIAARLDRLTAPRAETIKEIVREIHIQPSSEACRNSAPMRALDGRLRYDGGRQGGGAAAAGPPAAVVPAPGR